MRRRHFRTALIILAGLIVLAFGAGAIAIARFNPNSLKPRIVAAVQQATGRTLALSGPISLQPSLWPTVKLRDVSFANPPGFSRPSMATLQQLDVQLALWPLLFHRVEIDRLVLVRPDIRLETNAAGKTNWSFVAPRTAPHGQPKPAASSAANAPAMQISVDHVRIESGRLNYRDDATGRSMMLTLRRFDANADSPQAPLHVVADAAYNGVAFTLNATLGPIERLTNPAAITPWPVQGTIQIGAAKLSADGSIRHPMQGRGYDVALIGNIPNLSTLAPFAPGIALPPLHDVRFSTRLRDQGGALPEISALTLQVGASDLGSLQPGLRLRTLAIAAPNLDQPMRVQLEAKLGDVPLQLAGTLGPPSMLLRTEARGQRYAVDLTGKASDAELAVKGTIAQPAVLKGVDLHISAHAPDLKVLAPIVHQPLPARTSVAFAAHMTDVLGGLAHGAVLHDLTLTMPQARLSGEVGLQLGKPPDLTAKLTANRIDADALLAAFRPAAPQSAGPAPAAKAPHGATRGPMLSDTPLPFNLLRKANANIALTARQVISGGATYRNVTAHLVLKDGRLRLDPFTADAPGGHVALTATVDGRTATPPVTLTLRAPAVALKPLFTALHRPNYASGNMEVMADLRGAGNSLHAIAAGLNGFVGMALENGTVDARLLQQLLGPVLAKANLLGLLTQGGTSQVRCFAFRMDARRGMGEVRALLLNSSLLTMDGSGSVNLGNETLSLNLRPHGRVAGAGFVVPLRVTGSLRDPLVSVNAAAAAGSNAGALAGAVAGNATPLGAIAGALIGGQGSGGADSCAGPLAIARGQQPPRPAAQAAPAPAPTTAAKPSIPNPANLLRQLFH